MASNVTHYFFSQRIVTSLPKEALEGVFKHPNHYAIGNQGPDLFFFQYRKNRRMPEGGTGSYIHNRSFYNFYRRNRPWLELQPKDSPYWSYFIGFICHFALDITFHSYIDAAEKELPIDHLTMEREMDREILWEEELEPTLFYSREIIPHPKLVAREMVPFYDSYEFVDEHFIIQSLYLFRIGEMILHIRSEGDEKRKKFLLKKLGMYDALHGKLMGMEPNGVAMEITTPQLKIQMEKAYTIALDIMDYVLGKAKNPPTAMTLNFNGVLP
ncbi:MAG: zinc dependent phospholipase C family protein [Tissierellia bacterium]|nr:zinc dependent phospholipase C family protein [Tissierellia bacterium]